MWPSGGGINGYNTGAFTVHGAVAVVVQQTANDGVEAVAVAELTL